MAKIPSVVRTSSPATDRKIALTDDPTGMIETIPRSPHAQKRRSNELEQAISKPRCPTEKPNVGGRSPVQTQISRCEAAIAIVLKRDRDRQMTPMRSPSLNHRYHRENLKNESYYEL